jgi:hypothetical protein
LAPPLFLLLPIGGGGGGGRAIDTQKRKINYEVALFWGRVLEGT